MPAENLEDAPVIKQNYGETPVPLTKNSWLNTVGKYAEDSPLNRMLDAGAKIRATENAG